MELHTLPPLQEPEVMREILLREEYGYLPPAPEDFRAEVKHNTVGNFCAGKAVLDRVVLHMTVCGRAFSFPVNAVLPADGKPRPFFVHINFRDNVPDRYMPTEEIVDNGFAVLSFCYNDVTSDDGDMDNGLAGVYYNGKKRGAHDAGKIALWAWAAMRVMDYAQTLPSLDCAHAAVCGHSRLGKTALLTGALDHRFRYVFSNDSGCSGAAITRGKQGERVDVITRTFPYWFCEQYASYAGREEELPFDQHYLLALIAPNTPYVASAQNDLWSDPAAEFACCKAAAPAFGGDMLPEQPPTEPAAFHEGAIGYHMRAGEHYFSREDWIHYMRFIRQRL